MTEPPSRGCLTIVSMAEAAALVGDEKVIEGAAEDKEQKIPGMSPGFWLVMELQLLSQSRLSVSGYS